MSNPKEIWSTRLQREILALSEKGEDKKDVGILPSFISFQNYNLDIDQGLCTVDFAIIVECANYFPSKPKKSQTDIKAKIDGAVGEEDNDTKAVEDADDSAIGDAESTTQIVTKEPDGNEIDTRDQSSNVSMDDTKFKVQVVVTLDASIQRRDSIANASNSYPFFKPRAFITSGADHFRFMEIQNGDEIQIDCDWTPSLHLNDAVLNIALKVRESIKRNEPCLKVVQKDLSFQHDILDEVRADFSKAGAKVSSFFSDLRSRASAVADELDEAVGSVSGDAEEHVSSSRLRRKVLRSPQVDGPPSLPAKVVTVDNVEIGDEIDLSQHPWNKAVGMYPCKTIRRPDFINIAMESSRADTSQKVSVNSDHEEENDAVTVGLYGQQQCSADNYLMLHAGDLREVAGAGLSGAGSIFRSLTRSAKSLVEETFLMLTEELIMEIKCQRFSVATATVCFVIPISHLAKLKFRREESISLFFKEAPDDPIIYMCTSSADAVKQIQLVLKKHGVKGKHTNAAMQKTVESAIQMIEDITVMEQQLVEKPSREKLSIIMDLYRQAAERFELAGDARHQQVVARMREFLASPIATNILETSGEQVESVKEDEEPIQKESVVADDKEEAEVDIDDDDAKNDAELQKEMEEAESMLKSAHDDLKDLDVDDFEEEEVTVNVRTDQSELAGNDVISEFEDMLKDADKELQELMGS